MSEGHLGGDDLVDYVDAVLDACKAGFTVYTWYGDKSEAMAVGYKPEQLNITRR